MSSTQTAPSFHGGRNVDFGYSEGLLTSASGLFSLDYHPNGLVRQVYFGGGPRWTQQNSPHGIARPGSIFSSLTTQNWQSGEYQYDGSGNIAAIGDSYFLYDKAGRVRYSAEGGSGRSYSYDSFGNRTGFPPADPTTNRLTGTGYAYDEAGNLTREGSTTLGYDWLSSLTGLSDSTYGRLFDYIYTAGDERIGSYNANLGTWTWTIRDLAGKVLSEYNSTTGWRKDYVYRNGALAVALSGTNSVFMVDHLGTPRQITPWDGSASVRHDYHAFGEEVTNPAVDTEPMKFGGYARDFCCLSNGIGGDDRHGGLFYSSTLGRLRSVGAYSNSSNSQTWNAYSAYMSGVPRLAAPQSDDKGNPPQRCGDDCNASIDVVARLPNISPALWRLLYRLPQPRVGAPLPVQPPVLRPNPSPQPSTPPENTEQFLDCLTTQLEQLQELNPFNYAALANQIGNILAGETGRVGVGGSPSHGTTWQHRVAGAIAREAKRAGATPGTVRHINVVGRGLGHLGVGLMIGEGLFDIGYILWAVEECARAN